MSSKITTSHDEIRRWTEERGGKPATVKSTQSNDEAGVLRIDFPGYSGAGSLLRQRVIRNDSLCINR
jgi:hypothetical protein